MHEVHVASVSEKRFPLKLTMFTVAYLNTHHLHYFQAIKCAVKEPLSNFWFYNVVIRDPKNKELL